MTFEAFLWSPISNEYKTFPEKFRAYAKYYAPEEDREKNQKIIDRYYKEEGA